VGAASTVMSWSTRKQTRGEARSKGEGRRRRGGVHRGRGETMVATLFSGGVAMASTTVVDEDQGGREKGCDGDGSTF
jgi:hypothetical protein